MESTTTFYLKERSSMKMVLVQLIALLALSASHLNAQSFVYLFEDFESSDPVSGALPQGWGTSTTEVGSISEASFRVWNRQLGNSVGYFPVPETGDNNLFAGIRNSNADFGDY